MHGAKGTESENPQRRDRPLWDLLESERALRHIQLETIELVEIACCIHPPANFLVFGLGNDSPLWRDLNPGGRTVFIEDDPEWFDRVTSNHPGLEACLVNYATVRESWQALLDQPESLWLDLPDTVARQRWDVILVDGPAGYENGTPGRMKSIYMASQLIRSGGTVLLHDAERTIEGAYAVRYLGTGNVLSEVTGRALLRSYCIR